MAIWTNVEWLIIMYNLLQDVLPNCHFIYWLLAVFVSVICVMLSKFLIQLFLLEA